MNANPFFRAYLIEQSGLVIIAVLIGLLGHSGFMALGVLFMALLLFSINLFYIKSSQEINKMVKTDQQDFYTLPAKQLLFTSYINGDIERKKMIARLSALPVDIEYLWQLITLVPTLTRAQQELAEDYIGLVRLQIGIMDAKSEDQRRANYPID